MSSLHARDQGSQSGAGVSTPATVICVAPIKNEAWILDRFLASASLWADHILLLDQASDDGSRDIARRYAKAVLLENPSPVFNEPERQRLLIEAARRIPGRRLIVALDADEFLTANWRECPEWQTALVAPEGTVFRFPYIQVLPGLSNCWIMPPTAFAVLDEGAEHQGRPIHSPRIPMRTTSPLVDLHHIGVLHYQYIEWERMKSKQRWYQCWETLHQPDQRPVQLYRRYHHMDAISSPLEPFRREWIEGYEREGVDMTSIRREPFYRWDREILALLAEHGAGRFRRTAIWDVDWAGKQRLLEVDVDPAALRDPRSRLDRLVSRWLRRTQARADTRSVRRVDSLLRWIGW